MALQKQSENVEAFRGLIECCYALKRPEDVKRYLDQGLKVNPNNPWLREQSIAYDLTFGDPSKAVISREEIAKKNPESLGAQIAYAAAEWQVAQFYVQKAKPEESRDHTAKARDAFGRVVAKWPDDRLAYAYLADICTASNDFAGGEKFLKDLTARKAWSDLPEAFVLLGDYYFRFGKNEQADAAFAEGLAKLGNSKDEGVNLDTRRKVASFY